MPILSRLYSGMRMNCCYVDYSIFIGHLSQTYHCYACYSTGAQTATYNIPGISEHAYYLKDVDHAQLIRKNIIDSFETALCPGQPEEEVRRLLSFVVVGGGPTGECHN